MLKKAMIMTRVLGTTIWVSKLDGFMGMGISNFSEINPVLLIMIKV